MSSILKALRKLEEEKASRKEEGSTLVARDILRGRYPARRRGLWVPVAAGLFLISGALIGYFFRPDPFQAQAPQKVQAPLSIPSPSEEGNESAPAPDYVFPALVGNDSEIIEEAFSPPVPVQAGVQKRADSRGTARFLPSPQVQRDAPAETTHGAQPETGRIPALPEDPPVTLTISGIAWQDESDLRLAIINDLPVMTGTMIEGARVEEILRDRVRFSMEGKSFEVVMEK